MNQDSLEDRKERFKALSRTERQALIREKIRAQGLEEGSGVKGATYDEEEVWNLIRITSCFPEMETRRS